MRLIDCFAPLISYTFQNQLTTGIEEIAPLKVQEQFLELTALCRQNCDQQGFSQEQRENALFAVIAWIDEQRLCDNDTDRQWLHLELQKVLFNTSIAGDEFYNRFAIIPELDDQVREVFAYCLVLGFRGRMYDSPEMFTDFCQVSFGSDIESLSGQFSEQLFGEGFLGAQKGQRLKTFSLFPVPFHLAVVLLSVGLLGGLFFFCQRSLNVLYASLPTVGL